MNSNAIILAGGFGTRLQSIITDVPKPMAPINGKPFLEYQLNYLQQFNITKLIFSTGYKAEIINAYFGNHYNGIPIVYAHETTPLGTGGGILNALKKCDSEHVLILNGDTFFTIDIHQFYQTHIDYKADVTICLRQLNDTSRYGTVLISPQKKIIAFAEKTHLSLPGLINGGIYLFKKSCIEQFKLPQKFSIESDFFEKHLSELHMIGFESNAYFIDIGVPEDYARAQLEMIL